MDLRLDENDKPKLGEEPISSTDYLAYKHDLAYRDSTSLDQKHDADKRMVEALEKVSTTGISDKLANFIASKIFKIKLKLGMGLKEEIYADELHNPIRHKFPRRSVIIKDLDETWSSDLVVMPKKDGDYIYIFYLL